MTTPDIMQQLASLGCETTKNTLTRHGAKEPFFGVRVGDLKPIQKKIKKNHALALELYETGNSDAMYLAGLIADETAMTKEDLQRWAEQAYWYMLSEYTVAWVASESKYGFELAKEWIKSDNERLVTAGWATLSNLGGIKPDHELDLDYLSQQLDFVQQHIHSSLNRIRYTMNGFVIAMGSFVPALTEKARAVAAAIGKVEVYMGQTSCKVPEASPYIEKVIQMGRHGRKKKTARC
ncbi:DNA alkylation repair protein [Pontibacter cellulosilyticus]|uniref:DNA alkylation repair protein n=1 Tax=Pontibacter cellulosilyticus TaxID=1720253 RepID=A0A923SI99_9BACT|nr:DNA alkylation repair protein [Pontibacter cellulosilyticus]MBC5992392.1 DNA alkylation repair protein [Pontibacter cellulosilyticus]